MGRINGHGREKGKQLRKEPGFQLRPLSGGHFTRGDVFQAFDGKLVAEFTPARLLIGHQVGGPRVDAYQLFARRQPILAKHAHAFADLGFKARHPHHVKLVEIVGADRQKPQALQQGVARVHALGQDPPVERQPGELPVEEPRGGCRQGLAGGLWRRLNP